jgi:hypothetical protein
VEFGVLVRRTLRNLQFRTAEDALRSSPLALADTQEEVEDIAYPTRKDLHIHHCMGTDPVLGRGRLRRSLGAYSDGVGVSSDGTVRWNSIHTSPSCQVSRLPHHSKKEELRKESAACNNITYTTIYKDLDKNYT